MKKFFTMILLLTLLLGLTAISVFAANGTATLTGPDTVRAGDTITLTFKVNGTGIYGASGTLSYDSKLLELKSTEQKIGSSWMVEFNGDTFVAYDNNLSTPINKNTSLFTVKFKVKSDLATGTKISVSYTDVKTSDGTADSLIGTVTYSVKLAAPKSKDNTLKSLTVNNATISPAFSAGTTEYTADVPFAVEKLDLKAVANDAKASVSVDNPVLKPGGTTVVTITVTAENGDQKVYSITVNRQQDPNYVPSDNHALASITVDGFLLSPVFDPERTQYLVWLPYETEHVTVSAVAAHELATVEVVGGNDLIAGEDNEIQVICTAENGQQRVYTVIAKRAASHDQKPTDPTQPPTVPTDPTIPTQPTVPEDPTLPQPTEPGGTEPMPTEPNTPTDPKPIGGFKPWMLITGAALCFCLGLGIGLLVGRKM